ncbi:MAG: hypothetical protein JWO03_299 [Bacteroidetes bacterium]|nr:hypothetical protein [Bacteroidota bacterium]
MKIYRCIFLFISFLMGCHSYAASNPKVTRAECYLVINCFSKTVINDSFYLSSKPNFKGPAPNSQMGSADSLFSKEDIRYMLGQMKHLPVKKWNGRKMVAGTIIPERKLPDIYATRQSRGWIGFYERYGRHSYYEFSVPLFSEDKTKCIISVSRLCGGLCGSSFIFIMEKKGDGWVVRDHYMTGIN